MCDSGIIPHRQSNAVGCRAARDEGGQGSDAAGRGTTPRVGTLGTKGNNKGK